MSSDRLSTLDVTALRSEHSSLQSRLSELTRQRNFYQLERSEVEHQYSLVSDEVKKTRAHLRNLESQMEKLEEFHRNEIKIYMQKVAHLEYEQEQNLAALKAEQEAELKREADENAALAGQLSDQRLALKNDLKKTEFDYESEIARLKESERKELAKLREQFERSHSELINSHEQRLKTLKEDFELRRRVELHEIEERKNSHINQLISDHDKNFSEMKAYYNSITADNLELIRELNSEIEDLRVAHAANEKQMEIIEKKNDSLAEPLAAAEAKVKQLKQKLSNFEKDSASLKLAKARLRQQEDKLKQVTKECEQLEQQYERSKKETEELYSSFQSRVRSVSGRNADQSEKLSSLLNSLSDQFQLKREQFQSVLHASNLDPQMLEAVTQKLDAVLSEKNGQIDALKYEEAKLIKAHEDLIRMYKAKFKQFGIEQNAANIEKEAMEKYPVQFEPSNTAPADLINH